MVKNKDEPNLFEAMVAKADPADVIIMMTGAWLGYNGWTPLSGLINIVLGTAQNPQEVMAASTGIAGGGPGLPFSPIAMVWGFLTAPPAMATGVEAELARSYHEKALMAGIGLLEAYALTRPGVVGGILQGVGEIIPG